MAGLLSDPAWFGSVLITLRVMLNLHHAERDDYTPDETFITRSVMTTLLM
jgi:hypothetical protein